ncbi:Pfs NB-ARC and Ankyrin domain [Fusarium albosuccineum]|uniref:Pfs NB-ARC and Ankyrin domain n=1 Tax=Fusarium albosuccineum TaxID=1237068 RepID=A0A8H4LC06_9HYPO|nr:Pfs NB-ARC and Ankyrin domain [Fusarium albosuccineum]
MDQLDPALYTVAWLAPLEIEARAALHLLDNRHRGRFPLGRGDDYVFQAGDVCGHNVIIATLPAGQEYGNGSAAALASQVKRFFPNLWFGLLVGVAAGLPKLSQNRDIRLGDVLVGVSEGESAGLVAFELGKETGQNGFQLLRSGHVLANTETVVRSAIGSIRLEAPNDTERFLPYYGHIKDREHRTGTFVDPGQEKDSLYDLDEGGTAHLVERERRQDSKRTRVWYGSIGSGDKLMKNARKRDELRDKYGIIGLEMEAAGTMNRIPVGVIRGVCDYGDEQKNKEWQPYAAAMAAAYAKAVLAEIPPSDGRTMEHQPKAPVVTIMTTKSCNLPLMEPKPLNCGEASKPLDGEQKQALLESLRFDQIDSRHETIKKAHAKTCKWLLQKSEYLDWLDPSKLDNHHGFLWIKGKPGAGKSTLMKFALNNARTRMKNRIVIAFFFNARGDILEKSTIGMYQSLLLQLLEKLPNLQSVFDSLGLLSRNGGPQHWSVESLKELFEQAVMGLGESSLVCFIDALDECNEDQIRDMISFFEHVGNRTTSAGIGFQVCFSSRHYPHITISRGLHLVLEGQEGHDQDIVNYLDSELKIGHGKLAEKIRAELKEKASGVFMWIVLVVRMLQQEHDRGHMHKLRQKLRDIPGDLHELFRDILTRDDHDKDQLLLCIQWVLFAKQPLEPQQLYFAILIGVDPEAASDYDPGEIEEAGMKRFILSSSKGLAEVTRSKKTRTVQFIHESVRDFLLKENGLKEISPDLGGNFQGESHERLKQCCLDYMTIGIAGLNIDTSLPKASSQEAEEARQSANKAFPFLEYAVRNVLYHADAAEGGGVSQSSFLQAFQLADWIKHDNLFEKHQVRRHTPEASLLYILSEYNLPNLVAIHPSNLSCFEAEAERYGPPLLAALATGSHEAVHALLKAQANTQPLISPLHTLCEQYFRDGNRQSDIGREFNFLRRRGVLSHLAEAGEEILITFVLALSEHSVDIKSRDKTQWTPLIHATVKGYEAIVQMLLDKGAAIEAADRFSRTSLSYAAEKGHEAIVQMLLDRGAAIEAADRFSQTSLSYAAMRGYKAIVRMLLNRGASIEAADESGRTSLSYAAEKGHEAIVQTLLDKGAAVEAAGWYDRTPLIYATREGYEAVVRMFLDKGASIEAADRSGQTSLSYAAMRGYKAIVRMLLDRGASIEAADESGRTSLSYAAEKGNEAIVRMLLDRSIGINAADESGRTSLSYAAEKGDEAIVKLLIDKAADIESADTDGRTPLFYAAASAWNTEPTVRLLLGRGAAINAVDSDGRTPLAYAVSFGKNRKKDYKGKIQLLLDWGAAVGATDNNGWTPLFHAAASGSGTEAIVRLLLNRGAAIDAIDRQGRTPLSQAVGTAGWSQNAAILRLLVEKGAAIDASDKSGLTPLSHAAKSPGPYSEDIIQFLLDRGASIEAVDDDGRTALSYAMKLKTPWSKEVEQFLLRRGAAVQVTGIDD